MSVMITQESLIALKACTEGIYLFMEYFPNGQVYSDTLIEILQEKHGKGEIDKEISECLGWFVYGYPGLSADERLDILKCMTRPEAEDWASEIVYGKLELTFEEYMKFVDMTSDTGRTAKNILTFGGFGDHGRLTTEQRVHLLKYIEEH